MEEALHALDKRLTSIEDWRDREADNRSTVRKEIFAKLDRHEAVLHGSDQDGGLVATVKLLAANQDELKRMTRWVIGGVFTGALALLGLAIQGVLGG